MKTFQYKGRTYTRILPSPRLYNSTTVRDVTNRGSIFALCLGTGYFTILPGRGKIEVTEVAVRKLPKSTPTTQLKLDL